jgi:hypothetical protein
MNFMPYKRQLPITKNYGKYLRKDKLQWKWKSLRLMLKDLGFIWE